MDKLARSNGLLRKKAAIEVMATNIGVEQKIVADKIGVSAPTMRSWLADPQFIEDLYTRYMEIAGFELPMVVQATIEEAKRGNVQAARLVLEHFGKLENRLKIQVESNFEKFMKSDSQDAEFYEVTEGQEEVLEVLSDSNIKLPERDTINNDPAQRRRDEKKRLKQRASIYNRTKTAEAKKEQNERYAIRKRAKAVDLDLLPPGRHTKTARDQWMRKLIQLESEKDE